MKTEELIKDLIAVVEEQLALLRLCLWIGGHGPAVYEGEVLGCALKDSQVRASTPIAMAAGQSANTILKNAHEAGIPVRDLYPVLRCALEAFINAAYLVVEDEAVAEKAIRHVEYAAYKQYNRQVGTGHFSMTISTSPNLPQELPDRFKEFEGKGKGNWTTLDAHSRISKVGKLGGGVAGGRLLGGYAFIYSISSEIIHGSLYGVSYFYGISSSQNTNVEDFRKSTKRQAVDILISLAHGIGGYLCAFFHVHKFEKLLKKEEEIFYRGLSLIGVYPDKEMPANNGVSRGEA